MDTLLIAGLGNPGAEYANTRHNVGFLAVEALADKLAAHWTEDRKFVARTARAEFAGRRLILCEPQTFMNASGEAVRAVADYYGVPRPSSGLLVVVDDADLPLGEIRLRRGGSSGGHHGLESVAQHLGTREFPRLRIGIGRQAGAREITGYVLSRFGSTEAALADKVLGVACDQLECWLDAGIEKAMNEFNGAIADSTNEEKTK
jgi:PTH1 family peptidyl-tRNA hydrolase